jgi:hypothetical protein
VAVAFLAVLGAAPAGASEVLVMDRDGHVHARQDPFVPSARDLDAPPAPGPVLARAANGPSVKAELNRLTASGELDAATAATYGEAYDNARKTLKKLAGYRRAQLKAVLSNVDAAASGGLFLPSRLPALFLTLQRNRAWWAAAPIPYGGQRIRFAGSRLVWQHYPGQGLQIQWLATFGEANGFWQGKVYDDRLGELLDEALKLATQRAGGLAWEYLFKFDGGRPPWVSGLAQGTALSAFSRAAVRLQRPELFEVARSALGIFRTPPPAGVRVDTPAGAHYLQYSYAPKLHIVNGFTQALNGLHDFAVLANDPEGRALFASGEGQLRAELPSFDTGAWSLYSRPGRESDLSYHKLLRDFLNGLCQRLTDDATRTGGATADDDPALFCDTAQRFTADLRTPPKPSVPPDQTLTAKKAGAVHFTLDKVATVSLSVVRDGKVVLARTARLGYGDHMLGVRPKDAGPHQLRLRAVDLAGNVGTGAGTFSVRPAKKAD